MAACARPAHPQHLRHCALGGDLPVHETDRPKPAYRDPFARRLAGERGEDIARSMPFSEQATWSWVTRTVLFDQFINEQVRGGVDMVVNLAAGLDADPIAWNCQRHCSGSKSICRRSSPTRRRSSRPRSRAVDSSAFGSICAGRRAASRLRSTRRTSEQRVLVITEGLIIYLTAAQVGELASDLAKQSIFRHWVTDLASPGLLEMLQKNLNPHLEAANAPLQFGPEEGPPFFEKFGWRPTDIRSLLKNAAKLGRLTWFMRLCSYLPESQGKQGKRPWSSVLLLERFAGG